MTRTANTSARIACSVRAGIVRRRLALSSALGATLVVAAPAWGQTVTDVGTATAGGFAGGASPGAATIVDGANGRDGATVTLNANASVVNWTSLNVGAAQTLAFNSAAAGRVAVLNRVTGSTDTTIAGNITTGGGGGGVEVWISNPNGITFNQASGRSINTQGFVATTLPIAGADFVGGAAGVSLTGAAGSSAAIDGTAIIRTNGNLLALVAPVIRVGGSFIAGTGTAGTGGANATAAFVTATDVTLQEPGSPLGVTIARGTNVGGSDAQLQVNGTVAGQRAFFVLSAQGVRDTLLNVGADVAVGAAVGANGVIVLNGNSTTNPDAVAGTASADRVAFDPAFLNLTALSGGGNVALTGAIRAGGSSVVLGARRGRGALDIDNGPATITSSGGIAAGRLSAAGGTGIGLTGANQVATTTRLTSSNGAVSLGNTGALTIGGTGATGTAITVATTGALTVATGAEVDSAGAVTLTGQGIAINAALASGGTGNVTLNAGTGALDLASTIDVAGDYLVTAGSFAGDALDLDGAVTLANGSDVGITDTAGGLTLAGGLTAPDALSVTAIGGRLSVTDVEAGTALALTAAGGITLAGGTLTGETSVTITGPVTLGGDTLVTTGGGPATNRIDFAGATSTINGGFALTATSNGTTAFGGAIGQTAALASIAVTSGPASLGGSVRTVGSQTYTEGAALTGATTLTITGAGGVLDLGTGLTGNNNDLTLDLTGVTTVDAALAGINDLRVDSSSGGTTSITGTISTTGSQVYADAATLAGNVTLASSGTGAAGAISLAAITGGGNALTVNTAGTTSFGGAAGGITTLRTDAAGTTAINASITTTAAQNYLGATTIGGAAAVTLDGGNGTITFGGTLTGPQALTIGGAATTTTFGGAVSGLGALTTGAGTTTIVNGGSIGTTGAQTHGGVLQLGGAAGSLVTLTGGGAGSFAGGVTGAGRDLALNFAGLTTVGANVTGVDALSTGNGGTTAITGSITTTGSQTWGDAVSLTAGAPVTLAASAVTFNGAVDGAQALTVTAAGQTTFNAGVGGATRLAALTVNGGGTTAINGGSVLTTGEQNYADAVTVGAAATTFGSSAAAGAITFGGTLNAAGIARGVVIDSAGPVRFDGVVGGGVPLGSLTTQGGGAVTIAGGAITTTGIQRYGSAVTLAGPLTTLTTGGDAVFTGGVVGNDNSLTLNAGGTATIADFTGIRDLVVGDGLGTTLLGTIETTGSQRYGAPTTLGSDVVLRSTGVGAAGAISFANSLVGSQSLLVETQGLTRFGGTVGLNALTTDAGGGTVIAGNVTTIGSQSFGDQVTLAGPGTITLTSLTAAGDGVFAGGVVGAGRNLTLDFAGTTAIDGSFTGINDLFTGNGGTTTLSGTISTSGIQRYDDTVQLTGATVLTSSGIGAAGLIAFADTVTGAQSLGINTAGTTSFLAGATGLASITTDAAGLTVLNGTMATTGAQSFGDAVQLRGAVTVTSDVGAGEDAVRFGDTVTGAQALTVTTAGRTVFAGAVGVGGAGALASLLVDGGGTTALDGGAVTTSGAQTYADRVTLGADTVLSGSAGSFAGGVSGNGNDLTLDFASPTTVADFTGIGSLFVVNAVALSGLIDTVGGQRYGAVTLTGATTLRSGGGTGAGTIQLLGMVDGAEALTVTTAGATIIGGAVGGDTPLASLTIDGSGPVAINGGLVATAGAQRYAGAATLGADTRLVTAGGDVSFASSVDATTAGGQLLSIATGADAPFAGSVSVAGVIGGNAALAGLAVRAGSASFAGGRVGTLAAIVSGAGLSFADTGALTVGTVDGVTGVAADGAVQLTAAQALTIAADVTGAGVALTGSGVVQSAGAIDSRTGDLTVDGDGGALQFAGTLRSAGGTIALIDAASATLGQVDAGATGTLRLGMAGANAIAGGVDQAAGTTILAGTLTGAVGGAATLLNDGNSVAGLDGFGANGFALHNEGALTVTGSINAGAGALAIDLDAGALVLDAPLIAATGTVALVARAGGISQGAAGRITAATLFGSSAGGTALGGDNAVSTLAGWINSGAGGVTFASTRALTVTGDVVAGTDALALTGSSVDFTGRTLTGGTGAAVVGNLGDVTGGTVLAGMSGAGDLVIAANGAATITTATSSNGALSITAGTAASLDSGSSTGAASVRGGDAVRVGSLDAGGAATIRSTGANVDAGTLSGAGAKTVTANTAIAVGAIRGAGAVTLTGGTGTVAAGSIGAAGGVVAALTINGGSAVTLGGGGPTDVVVAGATRIGQAPGATPASLTINGTLATGALASTTTGDTTLGAVVAGEAIAVTAGGAMRAGRLDAGTSVGVNAGGGATVAGGTAGGSFAVIAGNVATIEGAVTAGGAYQVTGGTLTLGTGATVQQANGAITLVSTGGAITGSTGLVLTSDADGAGGEAMTIDATGGGIALGGATLTAGTAARRSDIGVAARSASAPVALGTVTARALTGIGAGGVPAGAITTSGDVIAAGPVALQRTLAIASTGGAITLNTVTVTDAGAGIFLATEGPAGGAISATALTAREAIAARARGAVNVGTALGGDLTLVGTSATLGGGTASGNLSMTATTGPAVLDFAAVRGTTTLAAAENLSIVTGLTSGGSATLTAGGAIAAAPVAVVGGDLIVTAGGGVAGFGGTRADLRAGGPSGGVRVTAGGAALLGAVSAADLVTVRAASIDASTVTATAGGLTLTATGGSIALGQGVAGGPATLTATGAIGAMRVTANGIDMSAGTTASGVGLESGGALRAMAGGAMTFDRVRGTAVTASAGGALTLGDVTSSNGAIGATGASVAITSASAATALALESTGGGLSLGSGQAGGAATTRSSGATTVGTLAAGGAASLTAGGTLTTTDVTATGGVTLAATGAATLGRTSAGGAVAITANGISAGRTVAGATVSATSGGALTVQSAQAGGDATFDAGSTASLGAVAAGPAAGITIRALDAAITGVQSAARVTFVNRAPATNAVKLGNDTSANGFQLSQTEVNFVEAGTLTVDGGSGTIEVGALAFDADAGRTAVNLLSTGRIDVVGAVSGAGTGRGFTLGGTAASPDARASVLQVAATAGGGGRLLFDTANLELRADRIGVGQVSGFLDQLGFQPGGTAASRDTVAQAYVGNANSSLYNSTFGGPVYNPSGLTFVSANSLTVRYTDYALFQNTGAPGVNAGVALGSASPVNAALVLQGPGVNTPNSFALFGTINGISGNATAVLGSTVIALNGANLASTRLNGCIVGSGAGCLTAVVAQPVLNVFDASRLDVFRSADDLALPFDPIIGTNNEALFSGLSLADVPITATECTPGVTTPECAQSQEERK